MYVCVRARVRVHVCIRTNLQITGLCFLWGKHRAFLVTLAGTSAYVPLGQRPQGTCVERVVQHCDVCLDVVSIIGI